MKKWVIDASTLLAYLQGEPGAEEAASYCKGSFISAVNMSEVLQKTLEIRKKNLAQAIVHQAQIEIVPFDAISAGLTAELYSTTKGKNISLADRACIALGKAKQLPVVTGDHQWMELGLDVELVFFRPKSN